MDCCAPSPEMTYACTGGWHKLFSGRLCCPTRRKVTQQQNPEIGTAVKLCCCVVRTNICRGWGGRRKEEWDTGTSTRLHISAQICARRRTYLPTAALFSQDKNKRKAPFLLLSVTKAEINPKRYPLSFCANKPTIGH